VRGAVYIVWLELRCRVYNGIRAGSKNKEPIGSSSVRKGELAICQMGKTYDDDTRP